VKKKKKLSASDVIKNKDNFENIMKKKRLDECDELLSGMKKESKKSDRDQK